MPMEGELTELDRKVQELHERERAESQRQLDELFARSRFKNGAEALQAFRDLFDSDEEMEEFGDCIRQMREEERARYRG
jgi:predicted Zn-dependent peptidase